MNSFDMAKRHACLLCYKAFGRKYDLKRHENTVHAQFEDSNVETDMKVRILKLMKMILK